jgi:hypothetical protein
MIPVTEAAGFAGTGGDGGVRGLPTFKGWLTEEDMGIQWDVKLIYDS